MTKDEIDEAIKAASGTHSALTQYGEDLICRALLHLHALTTAPLPEELAAIDARAEAATPGPWVININEEVILAGDSIVASLYDSTGGERDACFIAHARADVPRLLTGMRAQAAEIVALRKLHEAERAHRVAHVDYIIGCIDRIPRAELRARYEAATKAATDLRAAGGEP